MTRAAEIVANYLRAFNQKNWPEMLSYLSSEVAHDINQGGREIGVEAFALFLRRMDVCYSEELRDIVIMAHESGRVAAEFVVSGTYKKTDAGLPPARGQTYTLPAGAFYQVNKSNKIERVTMHYNLQAWLKMVK